MEIEFIFTKFKCDNQGDCIECGEESVINKSSVCEDCFKPEKIYTNSKKELVEEIEKLRAEKLHKHKLRNKREYMKVKELIEHLKQVDLNKQVVSFVRLNIDGKQLNKGIESISLTEEDGCVWIENETIHLETSVKQKDK